MKRTKKTIVISMLLLNALTYSQSSNIIIDSNPDADFVRTSSGVYKMSSSEQSLKKLYFFIDFNNKSVITDSKKEFKINNLNIDLVDNNFVSKINKDSIFVFSDLKRAFINNKEFIKEKNSIYQILVNGKKVVFKVRYYSEKRGELIDKLTGKVIKPEHYILKKEYSLFDKLASQTFTSHKIKKKKVLNFIDKKYKEDVINFSKNKELSFKKENDLKKILKYYNSL